MNLKSFCQQAVVSAAILASAIVSANAQVIYQTGFEPTDVGYPGNPAETWKVSVFPPVGAALLSPPISPAPTIFTLPMGTFSEIYSSFNVAPNPAHGGALETVYPFQNVTRNAAATAYTLGQTHYPDYNFYGFYNSGQNGWESYVGNFRGLILKSDDLQVTYPDNTKTALEHIMPPVADAAAGVSGGGKQFVRVMPPRSFNAFTGYAPNLTKTAAAWANRNKGNDITQVDLDFYAPLVEEQGYGMNAHGRYYAGGGSFTVGLYDSGHDYASNPNCPDPNGQFTGYSELTPSLLIEATISNPNQNFGFGSVSKDNAYTAGKWHHLTIYYDPHIEVAAAKIDGVFSGTEFVIQYPDCIDGTLHPFGTVEIGVSGSSLPTDCPSDPCIDCTMGLNIDEDYFYVDNLKITAVSSIPSFSASIVTIPVLLDSVINFNAPVVNACTPFDQFTGALQTVIQTQNVPPVQVDFVLAGTQTILATHINPIIVYFFGIDPPIFLTYVVPAGHYDIAARLPLSLRTTLFNVDATHDVTTAPITLLHGDSTDGQPATIPPHVLDNVINFDDFLIFLASYGSSATDVGSDYSHDTNFNMDADYNYDAKVDFDDFLVLLGNYGAEGDPL